MGPLINVKWSIEKSYGGACLALSAYPQNFDKRKNFYSGKGTRGINEIEVLPTGLLMCRCRKFGE